MMGISKLAMVAQTKQTCQVQDQGGNVEAFVYVPNIFKKQRVIIPVLRMLKFICLDKPLLKTKQT